MSFRHVIRKVVRNPTKFHYQVPFPGKKFYHFRDFKRIYYIWAVYAVGILIIITALVYYFTAKWYFHIRGGKLEPHEIPENFDFTQVGFQSDVLSNWCWWLNCFLSPKWVHDDSWNFFYGTLSIRVYIIHRYGEDRLMPLKEFSAYESDYLEFMIWGLKF